ncbi:unnamed protein product, partial [Polarella glacialis]
MMRGPSRRRDLQTCYSRRLRCLARLGKQHRRQRLALASREAQPERSRTRRREVPGAGRPWHVFCDLDGVLADFDRGAQRVLGQGPREFCAPGQAALAQMWTSLASQPKFFERLAWMPGGRRLWRFLTSLAEGRRAKQYPKTTISVLSGVPRGSWSQPQKRRWCAANLGPGVAVDLCPKWDKALRAGPGKILVDDSVELRSSWEAAGGRFVLHVSAETSVASLRAILAGKPDKHLARNPGTGSSGCCGGCTSGLKAAQLHALSFFGIATRSTRRLPWTPHQGSLPHSMKSVPLGLRACGRLWPVLWLGLVFRLPCVASATDAEDATLEEALGIELETDDCDLFGDGQTCGSVAMLQTGAAVHRRVQLHKQASLSSSEPVPGTGKTLKRHTAEDQLRVRNDALGQPPMFFQMESEAGVVHQEGNSPSASSSAASSPSGAGHVAAGTSLPEPDEVGPGATLPPALLESPPHKVALHQEGDEDSAEAVSW